jgi:hypothetical protein
LERYLDCGARDRLALLGSPSQKGRKVMIDLHYSPPKGNKVTTFSEKELSHD